MKTRDDRKKHRLEEEEALFWEASLSEKHAASDRLQEDEGEPYRDAKVAAELDPELAWKRNPNPWANWDEQYGSPRQSYVRGPDPTRFAAPEGPRKGTSFGSSFVRKLAAALLVFAAVWGLFQMDEDWAMRGQAFVKQTLTDEIDFASAAAWYKDVFAGAPSFIPIFQEHTEQAASADGTVKLPIVTPLSGGSLVQTFAELLNGVELAGTSSQEVAAVETGRVQMITGQATDGITVLIQHANNRLTIYGELAETHVRTGDWVEAGDPIGRLKQTSADEPSLLYFAVKQNDLYVDPVGVIPFD